PGRPRRAAGSPELEPPDGPRGDSAELHARLARSLVGLARVAVLARGDAVLPARRPATRARDDVLDREIVRREDRAAVLALVVVALDEVRPVERHLTRRALAVALEHDDLGRGDRAARRLDQPRAR